MAQLDPSSDNALFFKEKISEAYIDLSTTYSNVKAYMYDQNGSIIGKWSRETLVGYDTMFATDVYTLMFYAYRRLLENYKRQSVHLELRVIKPTADKDLEGDEEHIVYECDLMVGSTKTGWPDS